MDYRNLGRAGVKVSPLCLGCMNFGWTADEAESVRVIHAALDAGINFLDTANVYGSHGSSEEITGKALQGRRDQVVLATKFWAPMGQGPNDRGGSRYHLLLQCEESLKRLQTDRIDLYQMHRPDKSTPIDETLSALTDLVRQGKVLYLGTSCFPSWRLCESLWVSEKRNLERFVSEQPSYSMLDRYIERDVLPFCSRYGIGVLPWSPLSGGWLSGKYRKGQPPPEGSRGAKKHWMVNLESPQGQQKLEQVEQLLTVAQDYGATLSQFALAWLMQRPGVTAPIMGPRTLEQLEDNLKALDVKLDDEALKRVDAIVAPGTPGMAEAQYWPEPG